MTYLQPLFPLLLLLALVQVVRFRRAMPPQAFRGLALAMLAIFLVSWEPAAWIISRCLERNYPPRQYPVGGAQAIVVLASAVYPPSPPIPTARVGSDTYERCQYAAWLFLHWKALPVLASGGGGFVESPAYAVTMRQALEKEGVPATSIWTEERSRTTHENAQFSAEILKRKGIRRIVLVTDAYHMMRAEASFRKESLDVVPAACGYRTYHDFQFADYLPGWEPVSWNEDAMHESVGMVWYKLRGWI